MYPYKEKLDNNHLRQQWHLVGKLLKEGRKDEAKLVLEYIKVWSEIAWFSKRRAQ
jgi:hypothetical protein